MVSVSPHIWLITNCDANPPQDSDVWFGQQEDTFLAERLREHGFGVTLLDPAAAVQQLEGDISPDLCVIRNAWPVDRYKQDFIALASIARARPGLFYNSPDEHDYVDHKAYLAYMTQAGKTVIPTVTTPATASNLVAFQEAEAWVTKPLEGCSSIGVKLHKPEDIADCNLREQIIQPFIPLSREASLFFIDGNFAYAVTTGGYPNASSMNGLQEHIENRWSLREYQPPDQEITLAKQFVEALDPPCRMVRIDAGIKQDGAMLLMEIERNAFFLSLADGALTAPKQTEVVGKIINSYRDTISSNYLPSQMKVSAKNPFVSQDPQP